MTVRWEDIDLSESQEETGGIPPEATDADDMEQEELNQGLFSRLPCLSYDFRLQPLRWYAWLCYAWWPLHDRSPL